MIEALKSDDMMNRVGGRFKLTALIQKRWVELLQGARPLVDAENLSDIEIIIEEIVQGKIDIEIEGADRGPTSTDR